jgi:hypothetical protein
MPSSEAIAKLKAAYQTWDESKGGRPEVFLNLMAESVAFHSMGDVETAGLNFARTRRSREEVVDYFASLTRDWTMKHFSPQVYLAESNHVAVFGICAWTCKATDHTAECRIAHLFTYSDDHVVEVTEIFDSARAMAAATP